MVSTPPIPRIVVVAYRPKPGKDEALRALLRDHHPYLYSEGLVTEMEPVIMKAADGTLVEIFEWASRAAIEQAHHHPGVARMWERFADCCDQTTFGELAEAGELFPEFEPVELAVEPRPEVDPDECEE